MASASPTPDNGVLAEQLHQKLRLQNELKNGANWFYWIAGLSAINTAITLSGSTWSFIAGLGITQIFDAVAHNMGGVGMVIALMLNAFVAAMFILFGVFANKRQKWAFLVGMSFYALDGLLWLLSGTILGLAFHAFALFQIFRGMRAAGQLADVEKALAPEAVVVG